jgi:hypothetical protein
VSVFRRRKGKDDEVEAEDTAAVEEAPAEPEPAEPAPAAGEPVRPQGPWDETDAPDDEVNRIDLGGLRVPVPPDTEVRVDVSPEGEVVAATLVRDGSAMQINAFAAPRKAGIWGEVREEIAASLRSGGGTATEGEGPFGAELQAEVPAEIPGQGRGLAPARFVGVDGPRWFLRALLTGPAARDAAAAEPLLTALRDVVVVRGGEAMAVRDPLPLRLPKEVTSAASAAGEQQEQAGAPLPPPERGPEITEIR